jgi:hypothetical protein
MKRAVKTASGGMKYHVSGIITVTALAIWEAAV